MKLVVLRFQTCTPLVPQLENYRIAFNMISAIRDMLLTHSAIVTRDQNIKLTKSLLILFRVAELDRYPKRRFERTGKQLEDTIKFFRRDYGEEEWLQVACVLQRTMRMVDALILD